MSTPQTTITLTAPHRHAGRDYPAGATLSLAPHKAQWLMALGRATAAAAKPEAKPAPATKPTKE